MIVPPMAEQEIVVPSIAESVTEVTLLSWHKQPGDAVEVDEPLCEVETDKANADVPSEVAGVLTAHLAKPGDVIRVGDAIGKIDPEGKAGAAKPAAKSVPAATRSETTEADTGSSPAASGEKMATSAAGESTNGHSAAPAAGSTALADLSPAVRRLVGEHGLDASTIPATGPGGRLTKEDVVAFLDRADSPSPAEMPKSDAGATPREKPASEATSAPGLPARPVAGVTKKGAGEQPTRRVAMSKIRKKIAQNLLQAQQTAAILTTFNEVDLTAVMALRKLYKEPFEKKHGVGLGFMSFFAKAACVALGEFERVNARLDGDEMVYHDYVNLGIAVSTERGLTVPVLKNVQEMSFAEIEGEIKRVALAARDGKLALSEMSGGTFTITNGGVFGSLLSTPILNPPQSGILGMHTIQQRPMAVNGEVKIRPMMYTALSYDHRTVDGKESVSFLVRLKELLEDPSRLMLGV